MNVWECVTLHVGATAPPGVLTYDWPCAKLLLKEIFRISGALRSSTGAGKFSFPSQVGVAGVRVRTQGVGQKTT